MATFSKVSGRTKLKPRRDPYWQKLRAGCYVGCRKMTASSEGNWSARFMDESKSPPKQAYKALEDFVDLLDYQRHDAAKRATEEWFDHVGKGGSSESITVQEAWDRYIDKLKATGKAEAAADITRRYNRWIKPDAKLAATPILKLTAGQVNDWRVKLAETPATVGSFDKRLGVLTVGKDKSGQDRKITLPSATAAFFTEQAKDKLPAAPLFARFAGKEWNKDSWKYPFKDALVAAKLPANATAYTLRHSTITDLIAMHRLDTMTVAVLSGTSIAMIEKHYGHLLREHAAKALASLTL